MATLLGERDCPTMHDGTDDDITLQHIPSRQIRHNLLPLEVMSSEFDPKNPLNRWIPRNDPSPPSFISLNDHNEVKDALNFVFLDTGFACSIKSINRTKPSKKNQGTGLVTSFSLRCACGRKYVATSKGKRRSSFKMTGCECEARCIRTKDNSTAEYGWILEVTVPYHNHKRAINGRLTFAQNRKRDDYTRARIEQQWKQHDNARKIPDDPSPLTSTSS